MPAGKEWKPGEFVRYLAGNSDSENLIEVFKESSFVRNAKEYLEIRSPWAVPAEGEVNHPDLPNRKHLDLGMRSIRGKSFGMILEAKWITDSRTTKTYVQEIVKDIFRLAVLKQEMAEESYRFLLIGGIQKFFDKVVESKVIRGLLKFPRAVWYSKYQKVDVKKLSSQFPDYFCLAEEEVGNLPVRIKTRMDGRAVSSIGETRDDNPVHVRMWRVIPVIDAGKFSLKET